VRARAFVAIVFSCAFALACVSTQDLGAWSSEDAGPGASSSAGAASDPRSGFAGATPIDTAACPSSAPTPGSDCTVASGECNYELRELDQIGACGRSCVCARGGKWICLAAPCPSLDATTCSEGTACVGDVRCWAHCDQLGGACLRCVCRSGKMSCSDYERPPR
jgi:hypothetical protein